MTIRPYSEYAAEAKAAAAKKYASWLIPLMVAGTAVGGFVGSALEPGGAQNIAIGAVGGAVGGWLIQLAIRYFSADAQADERFTFDWCLEHACELIGEYEPVNGPHADSGHRQAGSDAIRGTLNGLATTLYNFSYWTMQSSGKSTREVEHPFKILQITGPVLPVASLNFARREWFNKLRTFDVLDSKLTSQRTIELESIDFNETFKLEIHDSGDDVWIRRVFDPPTINGCVDGSIDIPDLRYYDATWWLIDGGHYEPESLDEMLAWQACAARGIAHLSRIPVE